LHVFLFIAPHISDLAPGFERKMFMEPHLGHTS
jgi:hypothetical protein